jgi:hypothetical protein
MLNDIKGFCCISFYYNKYLAMKNGIEGSILIRIDYLLYADSRAVKYQGMRQDCILGWDMLRIKKICYFIINPS